MYAYDRSIMSPPFPLDYRRPPRVPTAAVGSIGRRRPPCPRQRGRPPCPRFVQEASVCPSLKPSRVAHSSHTFRFSERHNIIVRFIQVMGFIL
jgi:hypothetical protein